MLRSSQDIAFVMRIGFSCFIFSIISKDKSDNLLLFEYVTGPVRKTIDDRLLFMFLSLDNFRDEN